MSNFKDKFQPFIMGVMVGLIIAGVFFIFKLDNYFKELNFYKSVAQTFFSDSKNKNIFVKTEGSRNADEKKNSEIKTKPKPIITENSTKKNSLILNADTSNTNILRDSTSENVNYMDDVVVRKDELLFIKTLEVINLSPITITDNSKDSLLQKVSGVNEDRLNTKQFFIEFWQSPLNYKGYKMSKHKLVLYGIPSAEGIKVYKLEDLIYFKNLGVVYKLDYASDFKPYERITDETIINKLK